MAGLADTRGHLTKTYQYTVTGELAYGSAAYENEYTYNGESYNPNIHSQYLRARYYSVVTASFLTEDSYLGNIREPLTLNRYNYCISNYMNYEDPSGNLIGSILVTCAVIGGVIGLVLGVVSEVQRYDQVEDYNWTEGICNVLTDVVSGALGGVAIATTGSPIAAGWVSGTTHGLLDGVLHIDTDKSVEQNFYDIMYSSARDGFTGTLWGVGWEIMGSLTQGMYLSPSVNIFLQGAGGGALSSTTNRYLSGRTITAETVMDDAYMSGLQALAFNKIGRAVQRMVTPRQKLPKGYLRDRANSVAKLDASKQCGKNASTSFRDMMSPEEAARYDAYWKQGAGSYKNYSINGEVVERIINSGDTINTRQRLQTNPGTRHIIDVKYGDDGTIYYRETIFDEFGRRIGNNDYTDHGNPKVPAHTIPHHHSNSPMDPQKHGPAEAGLHPDTPKK